MPQLPSSGPISFSQLRTHFSLQNSPVSLGGLYKGSTTYQWDGVSDPSSADVFFTRVDGFTTKIPTLGGNGYFVGGYLGNDVTGGPGVVNRIEGINFNSETSINPSATLATARSSAAGVNSTSKGYIGGGNTTASLASDEIQSIEALSFRDESVLATSATLSVARRNFAGVNSSTTGYFAGGMQYSYGSGFVYQNAIDGIQFSTESQTGAVASISTARGNLAGVSSSTKGYFGAGTSSTTNSTSIVDFMNFSNQTTGIISSVFLALARTRLASVSSTSTSKGYFAGGRSGSGKSTSLTSEIDGITFSTDTLINPSAALIYSREYFSGVNSSSNGFFDGANRDVMEKLQFSTETIVGTGARLNITRLRVTGVSNPGNASYSIELLNFLGFNSYSAYFGGGLASTYSSEIDGFSLMHEYSSNPSATLSLARAQLTGVNSAAKGYFAGGYYGSPFSNRIDGLIFETEAAITLSATMTSTRADPVGVNSDFKGYIAGGSNPGALRATVIDVLTFSTETVAMSSSSLPLGIDAAAGCNNDGAYGHIIAGASAPSGTYVKSVQVIIFSTDATLTSSASLSVERRALAGVSNSYKVYCGGGVLSGGTTVTNLIDGYNSFSFVALSISATIGTGRLGLAGANGYGRGYFVGGQLSNGTKLAEIDGIRFDTDAQTNPLFSITSRSFLAGVQSGNL